MKILREPLTHFLFIGAAIYLAYGLFGEPSPEEVNNTVTVSAAEIEWMQTIWQKRWNRPPTTTERDGLIQQYIKETVLYREALTMGLDKDDPVIRRRLAQKLEFLAGDLVALTPPTDEEVQAYFDEHRTRYQDPTRFTFTQVFIDPDKRGETTLDDARTIRATLKSQSDEVKRAGSWGDDLMLPGDYLAKDLIEVQKQFGKGFAESLATLSPRQWHEPVVSGYGMHLVYVHEIIKPPIRSLADVRERVVQDWENEKRDEFNEKFYANLRDRYTIVIEKPTEPDGAALLQGRSS